MLKYLKPKFSESSNTPNFFKINISSLRKRRFSKIFKFLLLIFNIIFILNIFFLLFFCHLNIFEYVIKIKTLILNYIDYETIEIYNDDLIDGSIAERQNGALISLVRNEELEGMIDSIESLEDRYNLNFNYDWVFMNEKPFTKEFKDKISDAVSGRAIFVKIPNKYWSLPSSIDYSKMKSSFKKLSQLKIMYANLLSYRFMCRFNSGFFYKLNALKDYKYYWRVEPSVKFNCDIPFEDDPFKIMIENDKKYGFVMTMYEDKKTIETLWDHSKKFFNENKNLIKSENTLKFILNNEKNGEITYDENNDYNLCHYWSNFEIGSLDFFRSKAYNDYFNYLDSTNNFFYERWGDAPIHTIATSYLLSIDEIQFFDSISYYHKPNLSCPKNKQLREYLNCDCDPKDDFTWHKFSCTNRFFKIFNLDYPISYFEDAKLDSNLRKINKLNDQKSSGNKKTNKNKNNKSFLRGKLRNKIKNDKKMKKLSEKLKKNVNNN